MSLRVGLYTVALIIWFLYPISLPFLQSLISLENIWWYLDAAGFAVLMGWGFPWFINHFAEHKIRDVVAIFSILGISFATMGMINDVFSSIAYNLSLLEVSADSVGLLSGMFSLNYINSHIAFALTYALGLGFIFVKWRKTNPKLTKSYYLLIPIAVYVTSWVILHTLASNILIQSFA